MAAPNALTHYLTDEFGMTYRGRLATGVPNQVVGRPNSRQARQLVQMFVLPSSFVVTVGPVTLREAQLLCKAWVDRMQMLLDAWEMGFFGNYDWSQKFFDKFYDELLVERELSAAFLDENCAPHLRRGSPGGARARSPPAGVSPKRG